MSQTEQPARPFRLAREVRQECRRQAGQLGVSPAIHADDFIFRFVLAHPNFPEAGGAVDYYFNDGRKSALSLGSLLAELGKDRRPAGGPLRLLEFAAGYGCVTRHLRGAIDDLDLIACDIHPQAITFIEDKLGVSALQSASIPEDFEAPHPFDVVFASRSSPTCRSAPGADGWPGSSPAWIAMGS